MATPPVAARRPAFLKAFVVTMRPYLLFVSGAAGLVGLSFLPDPVTGRVVLAFVSLFLSYGLGQALTDCFQIDTDSISAPYRPLVRGTISRRQVLTASLVGLSLVVLVLAYLNPIILGLGLLAVAGLLSYTRLKRTWWGGPPWNSWIVALLPLMGRLVDRGYDLAAFARPIGPQATAFLAAVLAVFFGYMNFVIMGYFKDISADRSAGYNTFPVVFGWRAAAVYGDATAALSAALAVRAIAIVGWNGWSLGMFLVGVGLQGWAQIAMHGNRDEHRVGGPIANGVRALVLYCLAVVAANRIEWMPALVVFYALFELALGTRPERGQV